MSRGAEAASPRRGRGSRAARWVADFALGMRLSMRGGRNPRSIVVRLSLATIGIGLLVAVLLLGSSLMPAFNARADRMADRAPVLDGNPGQPSVTIVDSHVKYHGDMIDAVYLDPSGPGAPVPPGLREMPAPGEAVVSPALARLLDSEQGKLLRPRLGEVVTGTIGKAGLDGPTDMRFYLRTDLSGVEQSKVAYGFGAERAPTVVVAKQLTFVLPATAVLLVPLLIFIATTSRISGAERERRLSALRLAGGTASQVRRIAAAEPLVGLITGGILGVGLFLLLRQLVGGFSFAGLSVFVSDLTPPWYMILTTAVLVPVLTIGAAWFGMRGTIVEPLGVLRRARAVPRRGWWRLLLVLAGVVLMLPDQAVSRAIGAILLVIGTPVLMPWLTERVVSHLNGRSPASQLAVRRLRLDSATPTRVTAGVVVVLAATVALQTMFGAIQTDLRAEPGKRYVASVLFGDGDAAAHAEQRERVAAVDGVRRLRGMRQVDVRAEDSRYLRVLVLKCGLISKMYAVSNCTDGDTFTMRGSGLHEGSTLTAYDYHGGREVVGESFALPAVETVSRASNAPARLYAEVAITPAAAQRIALPEGRYSARAVLDPDKPETVERIRNVLAPVRWSTDVTAVSGGEYSLGSSVDALGKIKLLLYLGAALTMLLAGVSLLVTATQQVADRRKAFAAMNASGVPTGVLARSLLWQNAIPVSFGVVVASGLGLGVSWLAMRNHGMEFSPDWGFIATVAGAAVLLVLVVTAGTWPSLRSATRLDALRTE